MKRIILFMFALLLINQTSFAYDFSTVAPSGQTLYYSYYTYGGSVTGVKVTYPHNLSSPWGSYTKPVGDLIVPDTVSYGGITYSVISIDEHAFDYCTGLTSVTIPTSISLIDNYAFRQCTGLTSVIIPNSVSHIGERAFFQCTGLTSVIIPNSVSYIGDYAFSQCTGLTSATIGSSVRTIGERAFSNCTGLTSVVFNADSCTLAGRSIGLTGFSDYGAQNYRAFRNCTNITSFTFGNNVKVIPDHLCYYLTGLTSVIIPESVTSIGRWAFHNCTGLTSVVFNADSCTYAGYYYSSNYEATLWAFKGDTNITSFTFGNNVKNIPNYLCCGLTGLTSATIPDSVTNIGERAFYQCSSLTSVAIPNSVTSIGERAFFQCSSLTSVTIPNSVTSIGNYMFYQCTGLTSLTIPNSVTSIGERAFYQCSSLTSVTIPNSVTSIGIQAFYGCTGLTSVIIGSSVTYIGYQAFYDCGLTSITFLSPTPPTIYNGYSSAFAYNPSNRVVYVPCGSRSLYANIISSINLYEKYYELSAMSADDSTGTVWIITHPSCSNHNAVLSAVPANGYRFDHWSNGSTDNPDTLTVTSDTTITAFFVEYIPETYTVTVLSDNTAMGSVTGGGEYEDGTSATITAYPANGYHFNHWSTGSTDNPYSLTVTSDTTITAFFEEDAPATFTVTVLVDNPAAGSVNGGGEYEDGTSATITAYPANGYHFDHWSTGSTVNPYTLTVTSDTTITAYFVSNGGGTDGIGEVGTDDIRISVSDGHICVEGIENEEVRVYDITGRIVQNRTLPSGVYIVKVGTLPAQKVVVMR